MITIPLVLVTLNASMKAEVMKVRQKGSTKFLLNMRDRLELKQNC